MCVKLDLTDTERNLATNLGMFMVVSWLLRSLETVT